MKSNYFQSHLFIPLFFESLSIFYNHSASSLYHKKGLLRQGCSYVARVLLPMLEALACIPSPSPVTVHNCSTWEVETWGQEFMVILFNSVTLRGQHRICKILSQYKQQQIIFSFSYFKYVCHRSYHIEEFNIQMFNQTICTGQGMEVTPTIFTLKFQGRWGV